MRRRSAFRNLIEYAAALAVVKSLEYAPLPLAWRLARVYVRLLDVAIPRLRRVAYCNLAMALPEGDAKAITDGVFSSIARMLVVSPGSRPSASRTSTAGSASKAPSTSMLPCAAAAASSSPPPTSATGNSARTPMRSTPVP